MARRTKCAVLGFLLLAILPSQTLFAQPQIGVVEGVCQREWSSTHSGTKVIFHGLTSMAQTDSTVTREMGHFCISLPRGIYAVYFQYEGYNLQALPDYYVLAKQRYKLPDMLLRLPMTDEMAAGVPLSRSLNAMFTLRSLIDPGIWFSNNPR